MTVRKQPQATRTATPVLDTRAIQSAADAVRSAARKEDLTRAMAGMFSSDAKDDAKIRAYLAQREPAKPDPTGPTQPDRVRVIRQSGLTISNPVTTDVRAAMKPREDKRVCKARPKDNKPRPGGGGAPTLKRRFVPWC